MITGPCLPNYDPYRTLRSESPGGTTVAPSSASAQRRTRWTQGLIIAPSAVVIVVAGANLLGRDGKPSSETPPSTAPSITTAFSPSSEPSMPSADPPPAEQPVLSVVPATTVQAPAAATSALANVTYEDCNAVWDAVGRPINAGEPGFKEKFDTNHNGIGCEKDPR